VAQRFIDPDRLVFIDETGASTKMTRLYGRAPHGQRVIASAPVGHVWTPLSVQEKSPNRLVAGGRVLPCVRPLVRLAHGRGPVWDSGIRSTPRERARSATRAPGSPDPLTDIAPYLSFDLLTPSTASRP